MKLFMQDSFVVLDVDTAKEENCEVEKTPESHRLLADVKLIVPTYVYVMM